jgi:predicted enzyme related to lactoylglutathione lyase
MIKSIAFTVYPVTDMTRARKFYEGNLGLKLETDFQGFWVEYDVAGGTFAITSVDIGRKPGAPGALVAFEVDDLDAEVKRLKALGVSFVTEIMKTPVCRMAAIADPDGNHVTLHQRKA